MRWLSHRRDRDQDSLEQRIEKLADLYIAVGREVAELKAVLNSSKQIEIRSDHQALLAVEEQVATLARAQQELTRQLAELKAAMGGRSGKVG